MSKAETSGRTMDKQRSDAAMWWVVWFPVSLGASGWLALLLVPALIQFHELLIELRTPGSSAHEWVRTTGPLMMGWMQAAGGVCVAAWVVAALCERPGKSRFAARLLWATSNATYRLALGALVVLMQAIFALSVFGLYGGGR